MTRKLPHVKANSRWSIECHERAISLSRRKAQRQRAAAAMVLTRYEGFFVKAAFLNDTPNVRRYEQSQTPCQW